VIGILREAGMNKSDLIVTLAAEANLTQRKSEEIVNTVFGTMTSALIDGDRIEIRGFGTFMVKRYDRYVGRNPKTGSEIEVAAKNLPLFKTGKELREKANE
jgi:integration host factor subunit beta